MSESPEPYANGAPPADSQYHNASQQALMLIVEILAERPFHGALVADLVPMTGKSRDQVFRALNNLAIAGWAEQTPGGGWRLTPRITQLSERVRIAIADLHDTYLQRGGRHD